jgi:hypothetical protein
MPQRLQGPFFVRLGDIGMAYDAFIVGWSPYGGGPAPAWVVCDNSSYHT